LVDQGRFGYVRDAYQAPSVGSDAFGAARARAPPACHQALGVHYHFFIVYRKPVFWRYAGHVVISKTA
jgi:hypothetical protein